jgi:hypothetical protein
VLSVSTEASALSDLWLLVRAWRAVQVFELLILIESLLALLGWIGVISDNEKSLRRALSCPARPVLPPS